VLLAAEFWLGIGMWAVLGANCPKWTFEQPAANGSKEPRGTDAAARTNDRSGVRPKMAQEMRAHS
jgi:hypothetical protein